MTAARISTRLLAALFIVFVVFGAAGVALSTANAAAPAADGSPPIVREIAIDGPVDPLVARMARRGIHDAQGTAAAILIRIDTPGGLDSSMRSIIKAVQQSTVPVICWVGPSGARAASAGTFILIGCPLAAMAPGTNVGAAHPVGLTGDVLSDKVTNDAAAYIRSLAEQRHRNADWAESAVRDSVSITAENARDINVVDLLASDVDALLATIEGRSVDTAAGPVTLHFAGARVEHVHLTWGEAVLHALFDPTLAFFFFLLGIAGLIIEVLHPGISVPGVLGLLLLVTSLIVFGTLPVNIGGLLLLAASFVFFLIDIKVPGHGLPTLAGVVCLVVGGLYLYDSSVPNARVSRVVLVTMAVLLAGVFLVIVRAAFAARHAPLWVDTKRLLGAEGLVVEELRPSGRVRIRCETWDASLRPGSTAIIPVGARVRVLDMNRVALTVEPVVHDRVVETSPVAATPRAGGDVR